MGAPRKIGTELEKKQVQVRIPKTDIAFAEAHSFFGFRDLSKLIMSLWDKEITARKDN